MIKVKIKFGLAIFSIAAVLSVVVFSLGLALWFARVGWIPFSGEAIDQEEKQSDGTLASNTRGSVDHQQSWRMHLLDPKWDFYPLSKAGWVMSIEVLDIIGDG